MPVLPLRQLAFTLVLAVFIAYPSDAPTFPANEDLRHFRSLNDPKLSPDGKSVLIRIIDSTADGAKSHLWLVDIAKNTFRQVTYSPDSDKAGELSPAWMPDGSSILFLAHRGEHSQLFRLPINGGEAKPFDLKVLPPVDDSTAPDALPPAKPESNKDAKPESLPIDVSSFQVAPDGKTIAVIANDPKTPGEKKQTDAKADAVWVDHEAHRSRLYLLDPETSKLTSVPIPLDVHHISWKHDSSRLLILAEEPNGADDLQPSASAWLVALSDPARPEKIPQLPATISQASWSRDGNSIAFAAQSKQDAPPGYRDLLEFNLASNQVGNLTDGFNGSIGFQSLVALSDSSILASAQAGFETTLMRLSRGKRDLLHFPTPVAGAFDTNASQNGWVFLGESSVQPTTLFYANDLAKPPQVLNTPDLAPANDKAVASKRIEWNSDGLTIHGLLYLPPESANHNVPLILQVHGGPLAAYLDNYQPFVNFLIGHGWAVLRTNPRGSTNYGATFAAANKNDLGGGDYRDIMAGVDYVLKTEPIDANRLALEGYSYGGEMAGFVETKTSRFKAIVSGAPVIDQYSEYGTESGSYYDRWYFGKPWEHPQDAWRQSPLSGVAHATTPFLLLQGEGDTTDPLGQSQEMYRALRQMGVRVDLVTYPRDNHGPLARGIYGLPVNEPWHGFDARQRIVRFLDKELK